MSPRSSGGTAMASEESTLAKMRRLHLSCEQEIRACQERHVLLASSARESIRSIKPLVECALTNGVIASKDAKRTSISEAISVMIIRNEHLTRTANDLRAKKDEYGAVLSQQLVAIQNVEEKNEEDANEVLKIKEATDWYKRVLGFQIEGGEGVKFTFNKIDPNDQNKEYCFVVRLDGDIYTLLHCDPQVEDIDALVEELNRTNGLFKFVRVMREKFKEISCKVP